MQAYEVVARLGVPKEEHAVGFPQVVEEFLPLVENYLAGQRTTWGIPTQLTRLDEATGGLVAGELVVLAADPGMGKSALLAKILTNVARQGYPVWWCSFEMPRNDLVLRLVSDWGDVPMKAIQHGTVNADEKARLLEAAARLKALPLTLCDQPLSTAEIRGALLRQRHAPPKVIGIDYSMLLTDQNENETQRVANISRACKNLAAEFKATVILVHATDGQGAREVRPPRLNELSWGRRMQYDSDLVLSPWVNPQRRDHSALIAVLKKRNGESNGIIPMLFDAAHTRWADAPAPRREKG
jgi:replicative DNA helicase